MSVIIPSTNGYPANLGTYDGETCYDRTNNFFYVWNNNVWNTLGEPGPQGPRGKDVDPVILDELKEKIRLAHKACEDLVMNMNRVQDKNDILRKLTDLFMFDIITKKRFVELRKMMNSGDSDSHNMAIDIIDTQYQKHIG